MTAKSLLAPYGGKLHGGCTVAVVRAISGWSVTVGEFMSRRRCHTCRTRFRRSQSLWGSKGGGPGIAHLQPSQM